MTASVSASLPSGPHMWPEVRIIAGMEASTITSLGTCRLVMPCGRSRPSPAAARWRALPDGAFDGDRSSAGQLVEALRRLPRPSLGLMPASASASPYSSKSFGKKARTAWPKMIGSETFIIVALRWTENSTPSSLARAICPSRNVAQRGALITVASTTSPASTGTDSRSTVVVPSAPTSSMRSEPSRLDDR